MKTVELSDETYAALQRVAAAKNLTPAEALASLLGNGLPISHDLLSHHINSGEFTALADPTERYLCLLAWAAKNHASDFADFIAHQESAHHYLMLDREAVNDIRAHNHARQIDGTPFWAVMTIDDATKARFVRRLLEYIGCHDQTIRQALQSLGLDHADSRGFRLLTG